MHTNARRRVAELAGKTHGSRRRFNRSRSLRSSLGRYYCEVTHDRCQGGAPTPDAELLSWRARSTAAGAVLEAPGWHRVSMNSMKGALSLHMQLLSKLVSTLHATLKQTGKSHCGRHSAGSIRWHRVCLNSTKGALSLHMQLASDLPAMHEALPCSLRTCMGHKQVMKWLFGGVNLSADTLHMHGRHLEQSRMASLTGRRRIAYANRKSAGQLISD